MGREKAIVDAVVKEQKDKARAVQDDGFEGLKVLVEELTRDADRKMADLLATDDESETRALKADIRAIKRLLSRYVGYLRVDLN